MKEYSAGHCTSGQNKTQQPPLAHRGREEQHAKANSSSVRDRSGRYISVHIRKKQNDSAEGFALHNERPRNDRPRYISGDFRTAHCIAEPSALPF
jgi:hypothetical protein